MIKKFLLLVAAMAVSAISARATITIEVNAGELRAALGTSFEPTGGLLQLIATRGGSNGTFSPPTATSFVSGDNLVVASFAMNNFNGTGHTDNTVVLTLENTGTASASTFDAGDALMLRWYPTLTLSSTAPGLGATYGQYRNPNGENGGIGWVTPSDGGTYASPGGLNFLTTDISEATKGSNAPSVGYANNVVTAIPEPSALAIVAVASVGLVGLGARRRYAKAS